MGKLSRSAALPTAAAAAWLLQHSASQHTGQECADDPTWQIRGVATNCTAALAMVASYLSTTAAATLRCHSIAQCCAHFSAQPYADSPYSHHGSAIRAVGDDGTPLVLGCPASCSSCSYQLQDEHSGHLSPTPHAPPPPRTPTPTWDPNVQRNGCDDYSDTDCQTCTSVMHHSAWFGAPCIWDPSAPAMERCSSCYFCSASDVSCAIGGDSNASAYDWLYGRHFNTTGAHAIWYKTGYREKEFITVFLGSMWLAFCLLVSSPPIRGVFSCAFCRSHTDEHHSHQAPIHNSRSETVESTAEDREFRSNCQRFREFLRFDADDIMLKIGSDAARYLMFQTLVLKLFASLSILAICVTMPVNLSGDNYGEYGSAGQMGRSSYFFLRTTFHNLSSDSPLLWLHLAIFYSQSILLYYFIYLYHVQVVQLASAVEAKSASAACSMLIYGLPSYATRDEDLREFLQSMFPQTTVLAAHLVMRMDKLASLKNRYETQLGRLAYWTDAQRGDTAFNNRVARAHLQIRWLENEIKTEALKTPVCTGYAFVTMSSPTGQAIVRQSFTRFNKRNLVQGELMQSHHTGATLQLSKRGRLKKSKAQPGGVLKPATRDDCDEDVINPAADEQEDSATVDPRENDAKARQMALSYALRAREWQIFPAPESGDVIWSNLKFRPNQTRFRILIVNLLVGVFLAFFTTPITIISALLAASQPTDEGDIQGHTDEARQVLYDAATFGEEWPWILRKWVRDFLPSWSLLCGTLIVLSALEYFAGMERHNLKSELQRAIGWKTFLFLIISIFILPSILLDSFDAMLAMFMGEGEGILSVLGRVHGEGNGSFYTCIVIQSFGVVPFQLHRLHEVFLGRITTLKAVTPEEKAKGRRPWPHEYGYHYGYMMLIFSISLVYSADAPLIVPCGLIYFAAKHLVDKYNIFYVRPHEYSNSNTFTKTAVGFVVIAILIFQAASASFFSKGSQATLALFPLLYTIAFYSHFVRKLFFHERDLPSWLTLIKKLEECLGRNHKLMRRMQGTHEMREHDEDHNQGDAAIDDSGIAHALQPQRVNSFADAHNNTNGSEDNAQCSPRSDGSSSPRLSSMTRAEDTNSQPRLCVCSMHFCASQTSTNHCVTDIDSTETASVGQQ